MHQLAASFVKWRPDAASEAALACAAGACLGFAAWGQAQTPAACAVLPLLWVLFQRPTASFIFVLVYLGSATREIPGLAPIVFQYQSPIIGVFAWAAVCATVAVVWAVGTALSRPGAGRTLAMLVCFFIWLVPPLGAIAAFHPMFGLADILPAQSGWWGLGAGMAILVALATVLQATRAWKRWVVVGGVLIALTTTIWPKPPVVVTPEIHAVGIETQWGAYEDDDWQEFGRRSAELGRVVREELRHGATVIAMPETILGEYHSAQNAVLRQEFARPSELGNALMLVGMVMAEGGSLQNGYLVLDRGQASYVSARQSMPVVMWVPWSSDYVSTWLETSLLLLPDGRKARVSICWEDFLAWFWLLDAASGARDVSITLANLWFADGTAIEHVQAEHARVMAALFGYQQVRAINRARATHELRAQAVRY